MSWGTVRGIERNQRKLMADLSAAVSQRIDLPADPPLVFRALCLAMSEQRRNGRPIVLVERAFPEEAGGTTGLWMETEDQDCIVLEESLEADHKLVVLGHELWHMQAGHRHDLGGTAVAARAALANHHWPEIARTIAAHFHSHQEDEVQAERFGILMGSSMAGWLAVPGTRRLDDVARRIGESLGYSGPQGN